MHDQKNPVLIMTEERWRHIKDKPAELHVDNNANDGLEDRLTMTEQSKTLKDTWSNTMEVNMRTKTLMQLHTNEKLEHAAVKLEEECEQDAEERAKKIIQNAQRMAVKSRQEMKEFQKSLSLAQTATFWKAQCEHNAWIRKKREEHQQNNPIVLYQNPPQRLERTNTQTLQQPPRMLQSKIPYLHECAKYIKEYSRRLQKEDEETMEKLQENKKFLREDHNKELVLRKALLQQTLQREQLENQIRKNYIQEKLERAVNLQEYAKECQQSIESGKVMAEDAPGSKETQLDKVIDVIVENGKRKEEDKEKRRNEEQQKRVSIAHQNAAFNKQTTMHQETKRQEDMEKDRLQNQKSLAVNAQTEDSEKLAVVEKKYHAAKGLQAFWKEQMELPKQQEDEAKRISDTTRRILAEKETRRTKEAIANMDKEIDARKALGWNIEPMLREKRKFIRSDDSAAL